MSEDFWWKARETAGTILCLPFLGMLRHSHWRRIYVLNSLREPFGIQRQIKRDLE